MKRMNAFSETELPYNAYKHEVTSDIVHEGIEYKDFAFNNYIKSSIRVLKGYNHPKTGETCSVLKYRCSREQENVDYSICIDREINSFKEAISILKQIDSEKFSGFFKELMKD